jgi:hypothetical protein
MAPLTKGIPAVDFSRSAMAGVNRATQLNGHERHSLRLSTWQPVLALIFWVMIGGRRGKPIPATATANNAIRSVTPAWERSVSHKVESGNLTLLFLFDPFRVSEFWRNSPRVARHPGLSTLVPPPFDAHTAFVQQPDLGSDERGTEVQFICLVTIFCNPE